jgi:DNA-binding MarR family transcriptional regulator
VVQQAVQQGDERRISMEHRPSLIGQLGGPRPAEPRFIGGRTASDVPGLDIGELRSWQNFLDASLRLTARINRVLTDAHQIGLSDVRLLHRLQKSEGGAARMGDLADSLVVSASRISRQVGRLEDKGLARRMPSEKDGRSVLAVITDRGRGLLGAAMVTYGDAIRAHYLQQLSRPQTAAMAENCRRINAALLHDDSAL